MVSFVMIPIYEYISYIRTTLVIVSRMAENVNDIPRVQELILLPEQTKNHFLRRIVNMLFLRRRKKVFSPISLDYLKMKAGNSSYHRIFCISCNLTETSF